MIYIDSGNNRLKSGSNPLGSKTFLATRKKNHRTKAKTCIRKIMSHVRQNSNIAGVESSLGHTYTSTLSTASTIFLKSTIHVCMDTIALLQRNFCSSHTHAASQKNAQRINDWNVFGNNMFKMITKSSNGPINQSDNTCVCRWRAAAVAHLVILRNKTTIPGIIVITSWNKVILRSRQR